jgi:hypothetical protein
MEVSQIKNAGIFFAEVFMAWGYAVFRTGNPYEPGSYYAESWFAGWNAAQAENTPLKPCSFSRRARSA